MGDTDLLLKVTDSLLGKGRYLKKDVMKFDETWCVCVLNKLDYSLFPLVCLCLWSSSFYQIYGFAMGTNTYLLDTSRIAELRL